MERTGEFALFRASPDPDNGGIVFTFGQPAPAIMDSAGVLWVRSAINSGPGGGNVSQSFIDGTTDNYPFPFDPSFNAVTQGSMTYGYDEAFDSWDRVRVGSNAADAMTTQTLGVLRTAASMWGFNGATFDRLRSGGNNADNVTTTTLGNLNVRGFNYIWDAAGGNWDRWTGAVTATFSGTLGNNADDVATVTTGLAGSVSYLYGFDGVTFDRLRSSGNNADNVAATTLGLLSTRNFGHVWNGGDWDRVPGNTEGAFAQGPAASGAAVIGNPVRIGANNAGTIVDAEIDSGGQLWQRGFVLGNNDAVVPIRTGRLALVVVAAAAGNTTLIAAPGAGNRIVVKYLYIWTSAAAVATTGATTADLTEGNGGASFLRVQVATPAVSGVPGIATAVVLASIPFDYVLPDNTALVANLNNGFTTSGLLFNVQYVITQLGA